MLKQDKKIEDVEIYLARVLEACDPNLLSSILLNFDLLIEYMPKEYRSAFKLALQNKFRQPA